MHVAVLGAGIAGVTTAYALARRGCAVTLVDRDAGIACGATHANGGQLSYSFTDSLAKPSFVPAIPGLIAGRDPAVRVRLGTSPSLLRWGIGFLRQCTPSRSRDNTIALLQLAMRSATLLGDVERATGITFAHRTCGKLVLLPAGADLAAARRTRDLKRQHGCETQLLGVDEARRLEPALEKFPGRYAAAVYSPRDAVGDAKAFAVNLAAWLARTHGVRLMLGTEVRALLQDGDAVRGIRTDRDELPADATVVCAGAWSPALLRTAGVRARIYPVRGYSVTLPAGSSAPAVSITDLGKRLLYCPLDRRMRVSGFADFSGFDGSGDRARIADMLALARVTAPAAADYAAASPAPWAGLRPMTPDGRPLTGPGGRRGLLLNCGHGMLGWTLACATAEDTADALIRTTRAPSASHRFAR